MKSFKYIIIITVLSCIASSCKKDFFTDVNQNPNTPPAVVPYVLLTSVEGAMGFTQGSTHCFFTSMFTQQTEGVSRQAFAYNQYIVTSQDLDDPWGNWYTSVMENDKKLMELADSRGDNQYSGVSRIIMAFALQQVVDAWGSVPYSQAFQGLNNLHPSYDSDVSLYGKMNQLVDDGINYLNMTELGPDKLSQHDEDVIYGGNTDGWIKFGHAIKARLAIHQSKGNATMASLALSEANLSFTSNADNAAFPFSSDETGANPRYQYNENRADISFTSSALPTQMASNNDPRYQVLFDSTFNDVNGVGLGDYYGAPDASAEFITYEEILFIKAEALLRANSDFVGAQAAFKEAIQASMDKLGVDTAQATAYIATHGTLPLTSVNDAINAIAYEEWISLYLNPEAWTLMRRVNFLSLSPIAGNQFPRRFLYTQTEYTYNGANVPPSTLYAPRLFWDQ